MSAFEERPPYGSYAAIMGTFAGLLAAGPAFAAFGARPVFAAVALTQTCARVVAASAGLRVRRQEQPLPAMR